MPATRLLDAAALERTAVVANAAMNRDRRAVGVNSYQRELGFDPLALLADRVRSYGSAACLDLCCGRGRALLDAANWLRERGQSDRVRLFGVDLENLFDEGAEREPGVRLVAASLHRWNASEQYDLVTCVHGLHYVGDKLGLIERAATWLTSDGLFAANLDADNLRRGDGQRLGRALTNRLRRCGFAFDRRRHVLTRRGGGALRLGFTYLGADLDAGPNYTGQEAVNSVYRLE